MPDYGHDLQFGFFLDPTTGNPERTVEIAHILDDLGYDLIGIHVWSPETYHKTGCFPDKMEDFVLWCPCRYTTVSRLRGEFRVVPTPCTTPTTRGARE
jgi:hypothetical protein